MTDALQKLLYCPNCKVHTPHHDIPSMYATQCEVCNCITNTLMRLQSEQAASELVAPDGNAAQVVENTPDEVTFFVESGEHRGYYTHNKHTGKKEIRQA